MCHGMEVRSSGTIPDLILMTTNGRAQFEGVVLGGILADRGMAGFADVLDSKDVSQIKAYLTRRAVEDRAQAQSVKVEESL